MSPPSEQLVRDYLNRLSLAAKGRLAPDDRQALVMRARDFIERAASPSGPATAMQVAALLSRLGDPGALVGQEAARLAAVRGEPLVAPDGNGKNDGMLRRRAMQASWHWPRSTGNQSLRTRLLNGTVPGPEASEAPDHRPALASRRAASQRTVVEPEPATDPSLPAVSESAAHTAAGSDSPPEADDAVVPDAGRGVDGAAAEPAIEYREPPIWIPRERPVAVDPTATPDVQAAIEEQGKAQASAGRPNWPLRVLRRSADSVATGDISAPGTPGRRETVVARLAPLLTQVRRRATALVSAVVSHSRSNPVEALAAVLLGLGGVLYPPVWLLGAVVALLSRVWDYRDKWAGLAGPILLLVIGTAAGISLGSPHSSVSTYVHEGWMYADVLSRVAAVLGTSYLVWRLVHGRRVSTVPPWNKPHRVN